MKTERVADRFKPWAGLALGTTGFFLAHQIGSDATFQDCRAGSPAIVILGMFIGLAVIALGALLSWRIYGREEEGPARHLVATVSVMASALFAIAVILPFIASMLIPPCWQ